VKPSGPRALSPFKSLTTSHTSFSSNSLSNQIFQFASMDRKD